MKVLFEVLSLLRSYMMIINLHHLSADNLDVYSLTDASVELNFIST